MQSYQDFVDLAGPNTHEGQWEAVTLFLRGRPERLPSNAFSDPDAYGRPSFDIDLTDLESSFDLDSSYIVLTRGWSAKPYDWGRGRAMCVRNYQKQWGPKDIVEREGFHPVIYVALGCHQNLFKEAYHNQILGNPPSTPPKTSDQEIGDVIMTVAGIIGAAGAALSASPLGWLLLLAALILFIIGALLNQQPTNGTSIPNQKGDAKTLGTIITIVEAIWALNFAHGLLSVAWPADGQFILCVSQSSIYPDTVVYSAPGATLPGYLNTEPDMVTVNQFTYASYVPPPPAFAFAGRWGAPMACLPQSVGEAGAWGLADRRVDTYLRSLAYWNAVGLVQAVESGGSCDDYDGQGVADVFPPLKT